MNKTNHSSALSQTEFNVLFALHLTAADAQFATQRELADAVGSSLGAVNKAIKHLHDKRFVQDLTISKTGVQALQPYKVDNAIVMAAGKSSRFVPISYEKPKGTLRVKGEVLIERTIRQLQEAGISDITVVVGYMKEQFLYLEDKFAVKIAVNEHYNEQNNNSTLKLVEKSLHNTYIVASDNYFAENVFRPYVYHAYYAATFAKDYVNEWCLQIGANDKITGAVLGGANEWFMNGEAYFDQEFSRNFVQALNAVYNKPETAAKLWEEVYLDHISQLDMFIKQYEDGIIYEFDSLDDVRQFDKDFITNVDSSILDNIISVLGGQRQQITHVLPIEKGLTNFSFSFEFDGAGYVYRHPGQATKELINRAVEAEVESIAKDLGLDDSFVHLDPAEGWKISNFIHITEEFDYHNTQHVETSLQMVRQLHTSNLSVDNTFDVYEETNKIKAMLKTSTQLDFPDFAELDNRAKRLYGQLQKEKSPLVLCHCDFYEPNILISDNKFYLIDWEYSGLSDYALDLGVFICCSDYTFEQSIQTLEVYFGRKLTQAELFHCIAYVSLAGYYWFVWALNKEAVGEPVGHWLHLWYRFAKEYGVQAESLLLELDK